MVSLINALAYLADKEGSDADIAWATLAGSVIEWHNVRYAALLVSSPKVADLLQGLDEESDSLADRAMAKQWTLMEFRQERGSLSQLAANYLDAARAEIGWPPLQLKSLKWLEQRARYVSDR